MILGLAGLAALVVAAAPADASKKDWNDAKIRWRGFEAGLAEAKRTRKPVCLVFYADWCKACQAYRRVFFDDKVVAMSDRFVMVRVNRDQAAALSKRFDIDGQYIPRTFFLGPDGALDPEIKRLGRTHAYFYDPRSSSALRSGMKWALKRLPDKG